MSGEVPGQVAARSFAIFWRLAISGKARQRNSQKIELSGGFKMLFYLCTAVLRSTNSALQVCMEKNVKFKHKFCINLWFFLLKKGRCDLWIFIAFFFIFWPPVHLFSVQLHVVVQLHVHVALLISACSSHHLLLKLIALMIKMCQCIAKFMTETLEFFESLNKGLDMK